MKVLFVTNMPPSYPTNGAVIQTYHFMRLLLKNHEVGLWTYGTEPLANIDLGPLKDQLSYIHLEPKTPARHGLGKVRRWSRWLSGQDPMFRWSYDGAVVQKSVAASCAKFSPDVIMFEQLHMSYPILQLSQKSNRPVLAFNAHDAIQVVLQRSYAVAKDGFLESLLNQRFLKLIKNFEREVVKKADVVFSVSEIDADYLQAPQWAKDWAITPNGVDTEYYQPLPDPGNDTPLTMVFIGSLSYGPNVEAIKYYIDTLHGPLRARFPDCRLKIVGQPTSQTKKWEGLQGIEFVGFHRDFRSFFAESHISIVPLLSGSGTRFKILESWAMGKPMVSTSIGAEGLAYRDHENILIADEPEYFVDCIEKLYRQPDLRRRLAEAGRQVVVDQYSWSAIVDKLEAKLLAKTAKA